MLKRACSDIIDSKEGNKEICCNGRIQNAVKLCLMVPKAEEVLTAMQEIVLTGTLVGLLWILSQAKIKFLLGPPFPCYG